MAIYSSGSVEAQKLLFGHTVFGDLRPLICGLLRYAHRAEDGERELRCDCEGDGSCAGDAVFFSDVVKELDAAREAGMERGWWCGREMHRWTTQHRVHAE